MRPKSRVGAITIVPETKVIYSKDIKWEVYLRVADTTDSPIYDRSRRIKEDVMAWLKDNIGEFGVDWTWYVERIEYPFVLHLACNDEEAAMQFKLTWC